MKKRNGFTLIEVLIVVIILGILAAIVIPQFSDASGEAKLSSMTSDLQAIRSQIQFYKSQHYHADGNCLPGTTSGVSFAQAMTMYTYQNGKLASPQASGDGVYGPYLLEIPVNPFNDSNSVTIGGQAEPGDGSTGWWYNPTTGEFKANDSEEHAAL